MKLLWIKIRDSYDLPRDESCFLALWKGRICIAQFDQDEGRFYISYSPADSGYMMVMQERESKFTHYIPLSYPDSYPQEFVNIGKDSLS